MKELRGIHKFRYLIEIVPLLLSNLQISVPWWFEDCHVTSIIITGTFLFKFNYGQKKEWLLQCISPTIVHSISVAVLLVGLVKVDYDNDWK